MSTPQDGSGEPEGIQDATMSLSPVEVDQVPGNRTAPDHGAFIAALPPGTALLVVQRGPNAGARFLLDAERTSVGRHPDADIFLDDVTVSRRHAEFIHDGAAFRVRDVGSLNGTYVNRDRVDDAVLARGDEVQIGKFRLTYHPHGENQG